MEDLALLIREKRTITHYLFEDAKEISIPIIELSLEDGTQLRNNAINKFFDLKSRGPLLCYAVNEPFRSGSFSDEWGVIGELIEVPNNILIFFDEYKDNHVIRMKCIQEFGRLVEETIVFTYYVTNQNLDFLIAWSASEQVLIGAGNAEQWVEDLIKRHAKK